jgi:hypothetical protein
VTRVGLPFLKKSETLASLNHALEELLARMSSVSSWKVDQKGWRGGQALDLVTLVARSRQKEYRIPSGPGAVLGIFVCRVMTSFKENGPVGTAGRWVSAHTSRMLSSIDFWAADLSSEVGSGVCRCWK